MRTLVKEMILSTVRDNHPLTAGALLFLGVLFSGHARCMQVGITHFPVPAAAPGFDLVDTVGRHHRLENYRGRILIVNFWATWCTACRREFQALHRVVAEFPEASVGLLHINMGEAVDVVTRYLDMNPVDVPVLLDTDSSTAKAYDVTYLPTAFVLDVRGRVAYRVLGLVDWGDPAWLGKIRALGDPSGKTE